MKRMFVLIAAIMILLMFVGCGTEKENSAGDDDETLTLNIGKLPDIGTYVSEEKAESFYKTGMEDSFRPSDAYGAVVPYLSAVREYASADGEDKINCCIYGIATLDGKLITDGIYTSVFEITSKKGETVYVCERECSGDTVKRDVITQDGTVLIVAETEKTNRNAIMYFNNMPCECILLPTNKGVKLYDFSGNMIVNMTEAFGADCYFYIHYCDGEKIIFSVGIDGYAYQEADLDCYCMSKDGELIYILNFGEYFPIGFEDGFFMLASEEGEYKVADVLGNIITGENPYSNIIYDADSKCFWCLNGKKKKIYKLDRNGEKTLSVSIKDIDDPCLYILSSQGGASIFVQSEKDSLNFRWFLSDTGEIIETDMGEITDITPVFDGNHNYLEVCSGDNADFYNAEGTYLKTIKGFKKYHGSFSGKILYLDTQNRLCINGIKVTEDFKLSLSQSQAENYTVENFNDKTLTLSFKGDDGNASTYVYDIATAQPVVEDMKCFAEYSSAYGKVYTGISNDRFVLVSENGRVEILLLDKSLL